jgi:hypothetical protein
MTTLTNLDRSNHLLTGGLEITALFLGCQVDERQWLPVQKLIWSNGIYRMGYVAGVRQAMATSPLWQNFFGLSPIDRIFVSHNVPAAFSCRMPLDRPEEMPDRLPHLGLPSDLKDPIAYVARSGGYRHKDHRDVFPEINPDSDGKYRFFFGLRDLEVEDPCSIAKIIRSGESLLTEGRNAIVSATNTRIGSIPGYIHALATEHPDLVDIKVERVNQGAWISSRKVLCSATCSGFVPFAAKEYLPIGNLYDV